MITVILSLAKVMGLPQVALPNLDSSPEAEHVTTQRELWFCKEGILGMYWGATDGVRRVL